MERVQTLNPLQATWLDRLLDLRGIEVTRAQPEKNLATIRLAAVPTVVSQRGVARR